MVEVTSYAPRNWSTKAQRLYNLATFAHFKACEIETEHPHIVEGELVMWPTPRAAWYAHWATRLYNALGDLPLEETPYPFDEEV